MKGATYACLLASALAIGSDVSRATTTVCDAKSWARYHYGEKATLTFDTGRTRPDSITELIKEYAKEAGFSYSSVGGHDPYKKPPLETLDHILQSESVEVSIQIETSNRSSIARAHIETFSFTCGATEDWRPYWKSFKTFFLAHSYKLETVRP